MPSASIQNTTPFTTYSMTVQAKNIMGVGKKSGAVTGQFNYNKASGGTETTFVVDQTLLDQSPDVFGQVGEEWKVHTFPNTDTGAGFTVEVSAQPWRVVVVGGGSGRSGGNPSCCGGPYCERGPSGGGGGNNYRDDLSDPAEWSGENLPVTIGNGSGRGRDHCCDAGSCGCCDNSVCGHAAGPGGDSTFNGWTGLGGRGASQCAGAPQHHFWSTIDGVNKKYGVNGGGDTGGKGIVVISYQTGNNITKSLSNNDLEKRRADYAAELEAALAAEKQAITDWQEDHERQIAAWEAEHGPRGEVFVHPVYDKAIDEAFDA